MIRNSTNAYTSVMASVTGKDSQTPSIPQMLLRSRVTGRITTHPRASASVKEKVQCSLAARQIATTRLIPARGNPRKYSRMPLSAICAS